MFLFENKTRSTSQKMLGLFETCGLSLCKMMVFEFFMKTRQWVASDAPYDVCVRSFYYYEEPRGEGGSELETTIEKQ